ncbi:uncharacterized protein BJ171DRAFT_425215, partial [Polychytrium aggregatum]|uniref:uncharacterized protein n=1 Tax=Polychytrium aggregatum TaxID=110093 RepID=UPI0022FEBD9B
QLLSSEFLEKHDSLDILVNNAGIAFVEWRLTDGIESQVMVNHLSHFLLTQLLLPTLDKTARIKGDARIVNVSSPAHASLYFCKFLPSNPKAVDWDAMCTPVTADPLENYGLSKLAQIHQVVELQRRLGEDSKVRINSCEPGFVRSAMATKPKANYIGWLLGLFLYFFGTHPDKAAKTQVYLALSPEIRDSDVSGRHFISPGTQKRPSALASDPDAALATWQWSESTAASILKRREAA